MASSMIGVVVWGALGALCVFRGFYHPHRAVVQTGAVKKCAGPNSFGVCDPSDQIDTSVGESVFATASAEVVKVGPYYVHLVVQNEPVILMYEGITPTVEVGQSVGAGQKIGESDGRVFFSVTQYRQNGVAQFVPPSAWLAVRGCKLVENNTGDENAYCAQGRDIVVPDDMVCAMKSPEKAGFALLPVTVELQ